jgi:hypothetical protein
MVNPAILLEVLRSDPGSMSETVVIERENVTTSDPFYIREPGLSLPYPGPGTLISALVIADDNDFSVFMDVDGQHVIDESFDSLETISNELERISAYQGSRGYVFSASEYEFQDELNIVISPNSEIEFLRQRVEIDTVR